MASMANLFAFSVFILFGSWVSANANGVSQEKDAVNPHVPAPSPPVYKAPSPAPPVKPPTTPVLTPPPVKAPYTPVPPVKLPPPPYTPSPPVKPPSSPPPAAKAPSPPVKPPYSPVPPVNPPPSPAAPRPPPVLGKDCTPECGRRCQLHSRKKICIRACLTCCSRCKCVPPGTYGNREVCGKCYTDMTTHGSRVKCP